MTADNLPCPRTLALFRPGEPIAGVTHQGSWSGAMPMTGTYRCTLCGADLGRLNKITALVTWELES